MSELAIAKVYGEALYLAAKETEKIDEIEKEVTEICRLFRNEKDLKAFIFNLGVEKESKKKVVDTLFSDKVLDETLNFINVLIDKNRVGFIENILNEFIAFKNKEKGILLGEIHSAVKLSKNKIEEFEKAISKLMRENVKLKNLVDEEILGGAVIYVNGKIIDVSIRHELESLLDRMIN